MFEVTNMLEGIDPDNDNESITVFVLSSEDEHWVRLGIKNVVVEVLAEELKEAIDNAMNNCRGILE